MSSYRERVFVRCLSRLNEGRKNPRRSEISVGDFVVMRTAHAYQLTYGRGSEIFRVIGKDRGALVLEDHRGEQMTMGDTLFKRVGRPSWWTRLSPAYDQAAASLLMRGERPGSPAFRRLRHQAKVAHGDVCPECGSASTMDNGERGRRVEFRCADCGWNWGPGTEV